VLGIFALHLQAATPSPWAETLDAGVREVARGFAGEVSVFVQDVSTGEAYGFDADRPAYLSSTIKVVVALAVLRQVDAGQMALSNVIVTGPEDQRDGVGPLRASRPGARLTIAQLLELMLSRSDNEAADLLIGRVGVAALQSEVRQRGVDFGPFISLLEERRQVYGAMDPRGRDITPAQVRELGLTDSFEERALSFSRMVNHSPSFSAGDLGRAFEVFYSSGANSGSMRQMGLLLAQVARCDGLSPDSCERVQSLMRGCRTGSHRIRAGLPPGVGWAHKTGTQYRRACDVGFSSLAPHHAVVIAACARDFEQLPKAEAALAAIGRVTWNAFHTTAKTPERGGTAH
jgi:beta-lactamase class A